MALTGGPSLSPVEGTEAADRRLGRAVLGLLLYVGRHESTDTGRQDWHRRREPLGEPQHSGERERQTALVPAALKWLRTARILEPLRAAPVKASDLVLLHSKR